MRANLPADLDDCVIVAHGATQSGIRLVSVSVPECDGCPILGYLGDLPKLPEGIKRPEHCTPLVFHAAQWGVVAEHLIYSTP